MAVSSVPVYEHDFYVISGNAEWENTTILELQKMRPEVRCISRNDWIPGRYELNNLVEPVGTSKIVVVGFTAPSLSTSSLNYLAQNVVKKMLKNSDINEGKLVPVRISEDAKIPECLDVITAANGWEDDFYEKLLLALDGANLKLKICEKQTGDQSNNDVYYHLAKVFENRNYIKGNEAERMVDLIHKQVLRNAGHIKYGINGSLIFYLSVHDPKALTNLWEMHVSGQLIANLAKILMPKYLQGTFLDKWKTEIDEAEYISELDMLNKMRHTTSVISKQKKQASGVIRDELSSQERESSHPPQAVMVNTSVDNFAQEVPEMAHEDQSWAVTVDTSVSVSDFQQRVPEMAHKFPFKLDGFQKQAILRLENKQSVFVVAHTSAGKTVVAEYAIRLSLKHGTKAIYTSPIKALSNQKYQDFKKSFGKKRVGLQTGDVQINIKKASCVIMTTEILRSKLYDPEELHGLEWVIFDEVHYFNNKSRGVVWEEALIMLPKTVNLVLLSATFSNTMEFANWIGKIKKKSIYVITTAERPVPLRHFLYTGTEEIAENQLFQTVDVTGDVNDEEYERALMAVNENLTPKQASDVKDKNWYLSFVKMLHGKNYLPAIVFTFTRKKCSENAMFLQSCDLTTHNEKHQIEKFLKSSLQKMPESSQTLSQITELKEMLKRGIGYHHSGVLPRMKEIVEQLFQKCFVKVLFATETFASGVNMPAKTVIFNSIEKYDGEEVRPLNPGEYIQMAGRAGRRGIDDFGLSIIVCKSDKSGDKPQISVLRSLQQGKPCPVESQFHLKDNMILNLAKRAKLQVEDVLRQSFAEYSRDSTERELLDLEKQLKNVEPVLCGFCKNDLKEYYAECKRIHSIKSDLKYNCRLYSQPSGQVVVVYSPKHNHVLGIILSKDLKKFKTLVIYDKQSPMGKRKSKLKVPMVSNTELYLPKNLSKSYDVVELEADDFNVTGKAVEDAESLVQYSSLSKDAVKKLQDCVKKEFPNFKFQCLQCKNLHKHYEMHEKQQELKEKVEEVKKKLSERSLLLLPQFQQRQEVLKSLNYFNDNMEIQPKGIVACQFSHNEVLLTEIIFENILDDLEPHEIASALSCMVYHGKEPSDIMIDRKVKKVMQDIKSIARNLGAHKQIYDKDFDVKDYVDQFKQGFADVVFEWAKGKSFEDIRCLAGEIPDGEIVNTMQKLISIFQEIHNACRVICKDIQCETDKSAFAYKVKRASDMIERDIMAIPSLYLPSDEERVDEDGDSDTDTD